MTTSIIVAAIGIIALILYLKWDTYNAVRLKREKEKRDAEELERQQKENEEILAK